jgi:general secretion pathway protein K
MLVRLRPESARIDINMASEGLLAALYRTAGASQQVAESLAAATLEYRQFGEGDEDNGAQVVEGTARIPEGTFRRGPFQTIEELGYLPGMDAALFRAIADDISVHGRSVDIDVQHASPLVRQAFDAAAREDAGSVAQEAASTSVVPSFEASLLNVRSVAVTGSGAVYVRDAVVEGPFDAEGVPTILRVVQGSLRPDERLPDGANAPSCVQGFRVLERLDQ